MPITWSTPLRWDTMLVWAGIALPAAPVDDGHLVARPSRSVDARVMLSYATRLAVRPSRSPRLDVTA